jgi:uncharacterized membrane protein
MRKLTLFGRSVLLIACELIANAIMWIVTALLFGSDPAKKSILNLAFLAWVSAPLQLELCLMKPQDIGLETWFVLHHVWRDMLFNGSFDRYKALDADHIRYFIRTLLVSYIAPELL